MLVPDFTIFCFAFHVCTLYSTLAFFLCFHLLFHFLYILLWGRYEVDLADKVIRTENVHL